MTCLLKAIHRPCCKQLNVGSIFFLTSHTLQLYHCAEGGMHPVTEEDLMLVTAQDVNNNSITHGCS